jgi:hypothetical protein
VQLSNAGPPKRAGGARPEMEAGLERVTKPAVAINIERSMFNVRYLLPDVSAADLGGPTFFAV